MSKVNVIKVEPGPATERINKARKKKTEYCNSFYKQVITITVVSVIGFIVAVAVITSVGMSSRPKAIAEKSFGTTCRSTSECDKKQNLICINNKCGCDYNHKYSNGLCREMTLGKVCLTNSHCQASANLTCVNGLCSCLTTSYWNGTACVPKIAFNSTCQLTIQCSSNVECIDQLCQCSTDRYWNGSVCVAKIDVNGTCTSSIQCDDKRNLGCFSGRCGCNSTIDTQGNVELYSNEARVCVKCPNGWRIFNSFCLFVNRTLMTQPEAKAYCESFGAHLFSIENQNEFNHLSLVYPSYINGSAWIGVESFSSMRFTRHTDRTILANNMSWWASGQPQNNFPFDTCVSVGVGNTSRLGTSNCITASRMPLCQKYTSPCTVSTYWNGSSCVQKGGLVDECNTNLECNQVESLVCTDRSCMCNMETFRNETVCVPKLGINTTCTNTDQCDDSRPFSCFNGRCGCNSTVDLQGNVELYSNEARVCLKCPNGWRLSGENCFFVSRTFMTQPEARTYCESFGAHLYAIRDQSEYNLLTQIYPDYINGSAWLGMESFISMQFTRYFDRTIVMNNLTWWSAGQPLNNFPIDTCVSIGMGNDARIGVSNCLSVRRMSLCQKYSSPCTLSTYWNGTACVIKKPINELCSSIFECNQAQSLICVEGRCNCNMATFRNGNLCTPKQDVNATCSSTSQCDDSRFLKCFSGRCGCNSTVDPQGNVELYSNEARVCVKCPNGWRVSDESCYFISRTLMTQPAAKSFCESQGAHLFAIKDQSEYILLTQVFSSYINGLAWVGIESFSGTRYTRHFDRTVVSNTLSWWASGQPQGNFPVETCASIGVSNLARLTSNDCINVGRMPLCQKYSTPCTPLSYWNGSSCLPKKGFNESCSSIFECNQIDSLICVDGRCGCNMSTFSNGSSCITKLSFNSSCTNNEQCEDTKLMGCVNGRCGCNSNVDAEGNVGLYSSEAGVCLKCPSGWRTGLGFCYFVHRTQVTHPVAKSYCQSFGAHLYACKTQEEFDLLSSFHASYVNGLAWIGLESTSRFNYRRDLDRTIVYANSSWWQSGDPSHGHPVGPCVSTTAATRFDDIHCESTRFPLCQRYTSPCPSYSFWNGTSCAIKKGFGTSCNYNHECDSTQSLVCNERRCSCSLVTYRSDDGRCLPMTKYGNNYYMFRTLGLFFADAVTYCRSLGLWLYTPNSRAEHEWVMNGLMNDSTRDDVWTGCTNLANPGQYRYTCQGTPNPVVFTNNADFWCANQPDNSLIPCVATLLDHGVNCQYFDDIQCEKYFWPVCEDDPF